MKKQILSILLVSSIVSGAFPMQTEAATEVVCLRGLADVIYYSGKTPTQKELKKGEIIPYTASDNLDTLYKWYQNPSTHKVQRGPKQDGMSMWYQDPEITELAFTEQTPMWIEITSSTSDTLTFSEQFVVNRDTRIGNCFTKGVTNLNFDQGITIQNGTLMFKNEQPGGVGGYTNHQALQVKLSEPIEVLPGGTLILENRHVDPEFAKDTPDVMVAPDNQSAILVNGGTVHSGCFQIERSESDTSDAPLIAVNSGEFIFEAGPSFSGKTDTLMPTYESVGSTERATVLENYSSEAPAVSVASGASVIVKGGAFKSSGTAPVFKVESGAELTLAGGTVKPSYTGNGDDNKGENTITTTDAPAITVEEGGTLIFADGCESKVSTGNENNQAIDLAGGANITQGDTTITVAQGEGSAENYVDNFSNLVLASGGTTGNSSDPIPANTVITPNGMTITGKENVPGVDENGTVTVPNGGATITDSEGNKVEVGVGESIPSFVFKVGEEVKTSGTIKTGDTLTLEPVAFGNEVKLDNYTWSWDSNDTKIATVDSEDGTGNGIVTGVAPGETTITATFKSNAAEGGDAALVSDAGDTGTTEEDTLTASFEVTVEASSSGGGGGTTTPSYSITTPPETEEGKITVSPNPAKPGDTVTLTVEPKEGYDLKELIVMDKNGTKIEVTKTEDGKYTFKMPASGVEIKTDFEESDPTAGLLDQKIVIRRAQVRDLADRTLNDRNTRVKFLEAPKTAVTYESSDDKVVKVDEDGNIRYTGLGEATITVKAEQTEEYKAAEVTLLVKVGLKRPTFTPSSRDNGFTVTSSTVKGAKKFQVQYVRKGRSFKDESVKSKTFTVDDKLKKGKVSAGNKKIYRIRVRAVSGDFKSMWSPVKTITTK